MCRVSRSLLPLGFGWLLLVAALGFSTGCSRAQPETGRADVMSEADSAAAVDADRSLASAPPEIEAAHQPMVVNQRLEATVEPSAGASSLGLRRGPASLQAQDAVSAPSVSATAMATEQENPLNTLPAGSSLQAGDGFATIRVFYATDRLADPLPISAYTLSGPRRLIGAISGVTLLSLLVGCYSWLQGNTRWAGMSLVFAGASATMGLVCIGLSGSQIEKRGVVYGVERGELVHGVSEVTVPLNHRRGQVERPSLLRFELVEDQKKHIVLTSATELNPDDFHRRLADTVASSPAADLLVFIHGYNVDFQSAVRRTAQIAVDLPFEGVPVCYSWPSQGSLLGYAIDENNAEWTEPHLYEFLQDLLDRSGAKSIHVVAHSMGNRPMTSVMQRFVWQQSQQREPLFDRIVLAAPDVDADRFRRDLAPVLTSVSHQTTLYASSSDQALILSKLMHGYPRAGESGADVVVVPGIETIDVSGIDLSLLGHSYYGDNESMLRDLYDVVRHRLPAPQRELLTLRRLGDLVYWQLAQADNVFPTAGGAAQLR